MFNLVEAKYVIVLVCIHLIMVAYTTCTYMLTTLT